MGSSLKVGLSAIQKNPKYREVIISLVDLPGLTADVIEAIYQHPHDLVTAEYGGKRGHPVKIGRSHWDGVLGSSAGDIGARSYLSSRSDVYQIAFDDLEIGRDLDTPADLAAFPHA
jgi:CTP:molybdopterin cytidylyltransferase MocA